jgi:hypothetical protein
MSEGLYTGICGSAKETWKLFGQRSVGVILATFGKYLYDEYQNQFDSVLYANLKSSIDSHGHSGCSILVEIQYLLDLLGARALNDIERAYILEDREAN